MFMRFHFRLVAVTAVGLASLCLPKPVNSAPEDKVSDASPAKTRTFTFTYSATVTGLAPGKSARIWIPVPPTNEDQEVKIESKDLPGVGQIATEPKYGNQILYVEAKADDQGTVPLSVKRGSGDVAGYHCWAKFKPKGKDWIPVDISEANKNPKMRDYYFGNLTEDRVAFSLGRDINLAPKQDGEPLNFFVYPYVEVDGKPYPADKVRRKFTFKD